MSTTRDLSDRRRPVTFVVVVDGRVVDCLSFAEPDPQQMRQTVTHTHQHTYTHTYTHTSPATGSRDYLP